MIATPRLIFALCCLILPASGTYAALPHQYRLQTLPNTGDLAHIGKTGAVSGSDSNAQPALWIGGVEHPLANPLDSGDAYWVNALNESAGFVTGVDGSHAARWTAGGDWIDLGSGIAGTSWTTALSDVGDCAISAYLADREHSFFSAGCQGSTLVDMGTLGGNAEAAGINSAGQVVGSSIAGAVYHPFIYQQGHMADLGLMPGYVSCSGKGINAKGHVIGACSKGTGKKPVAYFYDGSTFRNIGNLGQKFANANAINYFDVVVGESSPSGVAISAFVLDMSKPGSKMHDLNKMVDASGSGWHLEDALAVNSAGEIIVLGTIDFQQGKHFAVLVPID